MTICTCKKCLLDGIHGLLKKERAKCAKTFSTMYQANQEVFVIH